MTDKFLVPMMPKWPKGVGGFQIPIAFATDDEAEKIRLEFIRKNELLPEQVTVCKRQGFNSFVTHYLVVDKVEIK